MVTKIDPAHGSYHAESPAALKDAGNDALKTDVVRATHLYTLGIDLAVEGADEMANLDQAELYRLDEASGGALHALLSNRSFAHLEQGDSAAAVDDAALCCLARPDFAKGHMRLLAALQANGASNAERRSACARGLRACPTSSALKEALAELGREKTDEGASQEALAQATMSDAEAAAGIALTRRVADDPDDPRRFMAAGDLGSALALGAHGCEKDVAAAERYLRLGASGGDAASQRNLGLLLLQLDKAGEAAEMLRGAAAQGDSEACHALAQLNDEAARQAEEARFKLGMLASQGDPRAKAMLEQLQQGTLAF
tara:strand:- start:1016 stop:1957 length:942 start_codon:yes stop_codon:yes gene_type:complete